MPLSHRAPQSLERWVNHLVKRELEHLRRPSTSSTSNRSTHVPVKPSKAQTNAAGSSSGNVATTTTRNSDSHPQHAMSHTLQHPLHQSHHHSPSLLSHWPHAPPPHLWPSWWSPPAWSAFSSAPSMAITPEEWEDAIGMNEVGDWDWPTASQMWSDSDSLLPTASMMMDFETPSQLTQTTINDDGNLVMKTRLPPGIDRDDIHLDLEDGGIRLVAVKSREEVGKPLHSSSSGSTSTTKHSSYVSVGHYWPLDAEVTKDDITANFTSKDGVLEIIVNLPEKLERATTEDKSSIPIGTGATEEAHQPHARKVVHHPHQSASAKNAEHAQERSKNHEAVLAKDREKAGKVTQQVGTDTWKPRAAAGNGSLMNEFMPPNTPPLTPEESKANGTVINSMLDAASHGAHVAKEKVQHAASKAGETAQKVAGEAKQKAENVAQKVSEKVASSTASKSASSAPKPVIGPDAPQVPSLDEM